MHETIKAMLINTVKDCIKYETWMDPDMAEISKLLIKENKTEDEMRKIKLAEDFIENAKEYFDDIKEHDYYEQFVSLREQRKNKEEKQESANE